MCEKTLVIAKGKSVQRQRSFLLAAPTEDRHLLDDATGRSRNVIIILAIILSDQPSGSHCDLKEILQRGEMKRKDEIWANVEILGRLLRRLAYVMDILHIFTVWRTSHGSHFIHTR